jgi:hypothetical protein
MQLQMTDPARWVPAKVAAASQRVSERTLRRWIQRHAIKVKRAARVSGALLVALDSDGHTIPSEAPANDDRDETHEGSRSDLPAREH